MIKPDFVNDSTVDIQHAATTFNHEYRLHLSRPLPATPGMGELQPVKLLNAALLS